MKKNSGKGSNTYTGLKYESEKDLIKIFEKRSDFSLCKLTNKNNFFKLLFNDKEIGLLLKKTSII